MRRRSPAGRSGPTRGWPRFWASGAPPRAPARITWSAPHRWATRRRSRFSPRRGTPLRRGLRLPRPTGSRWGSGSWPTTAPGAPARPARPEGYRPRSLRPHPREPRRAARGTRAHTARGRAAAREPGRGLFGHGVPAQPRGRGPDLLLNTLSELPERRSREAATLKLALALVCIGTLEFDEAPDLAGEVLDRRAWTTTRGWRPARAPAGRVGDAGRSVAKARSQLDGALAQFDRLDDDELTPWLSGFIWLAWVSAWSRGWTRRGARTSAHWPWRAPADKATCSDTPWSARDMPCSGGVGCQRPFNFWTTRSRPRSSPAATSS